MSGGALLSGIAAGLERQSVRIAELFARGGQGAYRIESYSKDASLDNRYLATLAGDLAEIALIQGPEFKNERYILGTYGNWNSTSRPRYHFVDGNEFLEMTAAEVRGGLDGLVLAERLPEYYARYGGNLRLSQVLDMYYGRRGLFGRDNHASKRRANYPLVAPTKTLVDQVGILFFYIRTMVLFAQTTPWRFPAQSSRKIVGTPRPVSCFLS